MSELSKNADITILRQDKGRGVTILGRKGYIQKCVSILNTSQFRKLDTNPSNSFKRKVRRTLQKTKKNKQKTKQNKNKLRHKFEETEYKKLCQADSRPGLFFGKPKVHKL